ncbi:sensor histidine kinase [Haloarcula sp. CBA1130]|uniref:ATP-binding protein n=1 Tax=unclassified Haloarcula TaxID=2624677 RepID=UPI0012451FC8|nr:MULTISPECIES: ATP-binding protein [unclassified Haloarcula]KAA9399197.1 sensor histidine kinase [Haloarcula sp. CBA1129]KAA9403710.1 sensor histidine kinase [Haloarcula sp. CBA1130]
MFEYVRSLGRGFSPTGLIVAGLGFFLTRFTVTLAVNDGLTAFVFGGVLPLVLGLGLSAFGVVLVVGEFERRFVRTVTLWCLAGTGAMLVLVLVTLVGNGGMGPLSAGGSRAYLSNFLIGGGVGGALTGVYAGRSNRQQHELEQQAARLDLVNRILRDRVLNALTVIRGRVEIAESRDGVGTADLLSVVDDRSAGVQQVVENMKHITHGGSELTLDAVPVVPCVESGVDTVRETHPSADYDLRTDVPADLQVRANTMLDNLVAHLVENGVVYNDSDSPRVEVAVTDTEDTVTISVSDNGPGLPERQRDLLDRGEIGSYEDRSTGFGLDLVRLLVRSYGGRTAATVTDEGTTITLILPHVSADGGVATTQSNDVLGLPPRRLGLAVGTSLVAAVVMGVPMQLLSGSVPVIGALYGVQNALVGWITHGFHSVVFGLVYAALVQTVPGHFSDRLRYVGVALGWSLVLWLVAAGLIMPLWLSLVGIEASLPNLSAVALLAHLLWGGSLAALYRYGCRVWAL